MSPILTIAYLALAVGAISMTTAKTEIFMPLRWWIYDRNEWLGELVKCPYCTAHWLAFGAEAVYGPRLVRSGFAPLDYLLSAMAIVAISTLVSGVMWRAFLQFGTKETR